MPRRTTRIPRFVASLLMLGVASAPAQGDDVEVYLERLGLKSLLALHLEELLPRSEEAERLRLTTRLVTLYAELLESERDPAARADVEERARRLLAHTPDSAADELRLALVRGEYRGVERTAEEHRLRLRSAAEVETARAQLDDIVPRLLSMRKRLREGVGVIERKLSRSSGVDAVLLSQQADRQRQLAAQATFLTGWALYYQGWLSGRKEPAAAAEPLFAEVLDLKVDRPRPEEVSVDLRRSEPFSRAILGMAMVKSVTASALTAMDWMKLLDHEQTNAEIRSQAPAWRLVILLEHREYADAGALLRARQSAGQDIPAPWVRLAAVAAMEAHPSDTSAKQLAEESLALLAARGELAQVLDLATRYGADRLNDRGFAMRYVRGVQRFQTARRAHPGDEPAGSPSVVEAFKAAADDLEQALSQPDAQNFPEAVAGCHGLIGQARFFAGDFVMAKDAFLRAAESTVPEQAAESLWMAMVCLDRLGMREKSNEELALIDRFISRFPGDPRTPELLYRRAAARPTPDAADVDRLLAVDPLSPAYHSARRLAAQLLYRLWKQGGADGDRHRRRFADTAFEVLKSERISIGAAEEPARRAFLALAMQAADASVLDSPSRRDEAEALLTDLPMLVGSVLEAEPAAAREIAYRGVQLRIAVGDFAGAERRLGEMIGPHDTWSHAALVALFNASIEAQSASSDRDDRGAHAARVVRLGEMMLGPEQAWMKLPESAQNSCRVAVAAASVELWEANSSKEDAERAFALYAKLLQTQGPSALLLRPAARVAEALGHTTEALEWWRALSAGLEGGSEGWWEARVRLIALLARTDRARALEVLRQHLALRPEYGPGEWGKELRRIHQELDASIAPTGEST